MDRRRAGRATERRITALAIGFAGIFVALALVGSIVQPSASLAAWLPVHLLLAGAATTAIAGVMPFFSAAVTNGPPSSGWIRIIAIVAVAIGALIIVGGRIASPALVGGNAWVAGVGGIVFIVGLVAMAAATLLPLRFALGSRRIVIGTVYGVATLNVVAGATLASLLLLGWLPIAQSWPVLKPAHAWLNVFGFVSLVITGSMLHLLPTVAGARISRTRASIVGYSCAAAGPPVVAAGFAFGSTPVALSGALIVVGAAIALAIHAWAVVRNRPPWTTDLGWHHFATWSMTLGIAWFVVGASMAAETIAANGATAAGWQLEPLVGPIFIGWIGQVLVGAWSHLLPAVGPGSPEHHARQRQLLGRLAAPRVLALNLGVVLVVFSGVPGLAFLVAFGWTAIAVAGLTAVGLLAAAFVLGEDTQIRSRRHPDPLAS